MLESGLSNLAPGRTAEVYVIDGGIAPEHKQQLATCCGSHGVAIRWLEISPSSLSGLPLWGRMPVATYYKLLIPELLPSSVSKAVWLDCDVVVAADLGRLWDTELGSRHALAAQDTAVPLVSSRNGVASHRQLGIARESPYFNAGVMVVNLALWRRDEVARQALDYLHRERESVVYWDQEGLNAVLAGRWGVLDPRWNHHAGSGSELRKVPSDWRQAWIVHFTGNLKPWLYPGRDPSHSLYFRYLDSTAWAGYRPRRNLKGLLVSLYEVSGLRRVLRPTEEWGMRLLRAWTRRYVSETTR